MRKHRISVGDTVVSLVTSLTSQPCDDACGTVTDENVYYLLPSSDACFHFVGSDTGATDRAEPPEVTAALLFFLFGVRGLPRGGADIYLNGRPVDSEEALIAAGACRLKAGGCELSLIDDTVLCDGVGIEVYTFRGAECIRGVFVEIMRNFDIAVLSRLRLCGRSDATRCFAVSKNEPHELCLPAGRRADISVLGCAARMLAIKVGGSSFALCNGGSRYKAVLEDSFVWLELECKYLGVREY